MLRKRKPSHLQFLSLPLINLLQSSPFSSNPNHSSRPLNPRFKTPPKSPKFKTLIKSVPLTPHRNPTPSQSLNPNVQLILSLLSDPSNSPLNLDTLLTQFKPQLDSNLVCEILQNYKVLGRSITLEFFSWAGTHLGFRFDDNVVEFMADFLGRRKLFDDMKCLLRTVSLSKGQISTKTISTCIRFLGRQGRVLEALAFFEMMELEFGCRLDNLVFNNVLYVLCKKDSSGSAIGVALSIFRRIDDPDKYSYSNVIIGLCKFGRLESAFELFQEMGRTNLAPTRSAANVLVGSLCEMARKSQIVEKVRVMSVRRPFDILVPNARGKCSIEPAFRVFWGVLKLGVMPSGHVVNGLISELCRLRKFEEGVAIVKVVEDSKLKFIDESYAIMIKALCDVHRVNEACDLFERMVFLGLRPKLPVYNSIIRMYCKLGNVDEAGKCFKVMIKRRCEPDCTTYTMLIHAHCMVQNYEAAHRLLVEMIELGWHPHIDTYNSVDDLLKKNVRLDLSLNLERKMEIQNVCAHCKAGRLEAVCEKLNLMLAKGFQLPIHAQNTVKRAFRKFGKWRVVQDLLGKMDQAAMNGSAQA